MTTKYYLIFVILLAICFGCIRNEQQMYQGFVVWPKATQMLEMKEILATFSKASMPHRNGSKAIQPEKMVTLQNSITNSTEIQNETNKTEANMPKNARMVFWEATAHRNSNEEQMNTNRIKREIDSLEASLSSSIESAEDSAEEETPTIKPGNISKQTNKRQTSITGNGNRLSNLINLPVRLNVLANVLSKLNQGVLDTKKSSLGSVTINGSDNTISSLVNAPIDVDAVVNLLSQVDTTKKAAAAGASKGGIVDGLLGGLLGGGKVSGSGNKGLVGGLLDGVLGDGSGLLGGLLGNTLGDLLGALLGGDGLVGNLLGGVNGRGLVTDLLHNLLGGVVGLVDNLLELLVGILDGLLVGMAGADVGTSHSAGANIGGNHNHISSLVNAPARVEALINALSSLKQELKQQLDPAATANVHGTNIKGNNNQVSSLINLPVDLNLDLNLLSSVNKTEHQVLKTRALDSSSSGSSLISSLVESLPNEAPPSAATSPTGSSLLGSLLGTSGPPAASGSTNIQGNNNAISSLLNIVPEVDLNLNLLSEVTDLLVGTSDKSGVQDAGNPNEICFDIPISEAESTITGDNNKISNAVNVKPKIHLDLNLLSTVKETAAKVPTQRVCIKRPIQPLVPVAHLSTAAPPAIPPPSRPSEICFNVLVDQSGTIVNGNGNQLTSLINVDPTINLGLNLLSNVQQTNVPGNLVMKRICIPAGVPVNNPPESRCFKRTCTKWKQFLDHKCLNNHQEYPKYTITREI